MDVDTENDGGYDTSQFEMKTNMTYPYTLDDLLYKLILRHYHHQEQDLD